MRYCGNGCYVYCVLWPWVICHIGCYGVAYYDRVNMALGIMLHCVIWLWVLSRVLWHGVLHGVLWYWVLSDIGYHGFGYYVNLVIMPLGIMSYRGFWQWVSCKSLCYLQSKDVKRRTENFKIVFSLTMFHFDHASSSENVNEFFFDILR